RITTRGAETVVDLSRDLPSGMTDLGDVRVGDAPLLVAGRVVDDRGVGVRRPIVHLEPVRHAIDVLEPLGTNTSVTGERDGRFRICGVTSQKELVVCVVDYDATGCESDSGAGAIRFAVGTRDLVVVVPSQGSVRGRVELDPLLARDAI